MGASIAFLLDILRPAAGQQHPAHGTFPVGTAGSTSSHFLQARSKISEVCCFLDSHCCLLDVLHNMRVDKSVLGGHGHTVMRFAEQEQ